MEPFKVYVAFPRGLGGMFKKELETLGLPAGEYYNSLGCTLKLNLNQVWSLVYQSRLASRVMRQIAFFKINSQEDLYPQLAKFPWENLISKHTFAINTHVVSSVFTHSQYVMHVFKDVIVDRVKSRTGERPDVDKDTPQISLELHMSQNEVTVSVLYSRGVMHRRGYRSSQGVAPLKENLAAALIDLSRWDLKTPFWDGFCGSGTLLMEAWIKASKTAPGFFNFFQGFEYLPDFNQEEWQKLKQEIDQNQIQLPEGLISGSDNDPQMIQICQQNFAVLSDASAISVKCASVESQMEFYSASETELLMVSNPPYGERLGGQTDLRSLYRNLGNSIKNSGKIRSAFIVPDDMVSWFGKMPLEFSQPVQNGKIDAKMIRFGLN